MIATEILDAARESARTGKRVDLPVAEGASAQPGSPSVREIAQGAMQTYARFRLDASRKGFTVWPDEIGEEYWAPAIQALKPLKVYHQSVHVVIVQKVENGVEEGLYIWSSSSSEGFPETGRDNFHWTRFTDESGDRSPLGTVLAYRKEH